MSESEKCLRDILDRLVWEYQNIPVFKSSFSAIYWMNKFDGGKEDWCYGPYSGKATPRQISIFCEHVLSKGHKSGRVAEDATRVCIERHVGIDCSGFVYHVVTEMLYWLQRSNFPEKKQFYVDELLNGVDGTGRLRRMNADRWTSKENGCQISADEVRCGDLVRMRSGRHVAIVRSNRKGVIELVHSASDPWPGGVRIDSIQPAEWEVKADSFWRLSIFENVSYE